jgi:DNA-binding NtrC family response regulator
MILQLSAMTLIRAGYQVRAMDCCETAWEALQSGGYDLLVTDNHMPGMSGLDLVRRLHSAQIALPVIIASGGMDAEELARNQSLQPAIALPKPFTVGQLLATVARALLRRAAPDLGDTQASLPEPRDFASHWGINE